MRPCCASELLPQSAFKFICHALEAFEACQGQFIGIKLGPSVVKCHQVLLCIGTPGSGRIGIGPERSPFLTSPAAGDATETDRGADAIACGADCKMDAQVFYKNPLASGFAKRASLEYRAVLAARSDYFRGPAVGDAGAERAGDEAGGGDRGGVPVGAAVPVHGRGAGVGGGGAGQDHAEVGAREGRFVCVSRLRFLFIR